MGLLDRIDQHANLMNRMAEALHADLGDALEHQRLSAHDLRGAVMACMGCEETEDCKHWLEAHKDGADDTPGYCRNREMMLRLRD